jgi:hypothetical protein
MSFTINLTLSAFMASLTLRIKTEFGSGYMSWYIDVRGATLANRFEIAMPKPLFKLIRKMAAFRRISHRADPSDP